MYYYHLQYTSVIPLEVHVTYGWNDITKSYRLSFSNLFVHVHEESYNVRVLYISLGFPIIVDLYIFCIDIPINWQIFPRVCVIYSKGQMLRNGFSPNVINLILAFCHVQDSIF